MSELAVGPHLNTGLVCVIYFGMAAKTKISLMNYHLAGRKKRKQSIQRKEGKQINTSLSNVAICVKTEILKETMNKVKE